MDILWLTRMSKEDIAKVGGKGANLGELLQNKIPVPKGFVVSTVAYSEFLAHNHLEKIQEQLNCEKKNEVIQELCEKLMQLIREGQFPDALSEKILSSYALMGKNLRVAVRSSATTEDLAEASFAGQQETYLNVQGNEELMTRIKDCFASCFAYRAVTYRKKNQILQSAVEAAVVVQEMVEAETSGVMFTANVMTGNLEETVINASYGLGEAVVSGKVTPDQYCLNKKGVEISCYIGSKMIEIVYGDTETVTQTVDEELRSKRALDKGFVKKLFLLGERIQQLYGRPMDIEWAIKEGQIYILQARPITTLIAKEVYANKKIKLSKREKENLAFNLEHSPYPYYPLDFEVGMILGRAKEKLFHDAGITIPTEFELDDRGIVTLNIGRINLNKNIFHLPAILKSLKAIDNNQMEGKALLNLCQKELKEVSKLDIGKLSSEEGGGLLKKLEVLQGKIAQARFRYFIFPAFLLGRRFDKFLKKLDGKNQYDLLGQLAYKTIEIDRDLMEMVEALKDKKLFMEALDNGAVYLKKEYPSQWQLIERFLEKHGYKSDFNCYPFSASSWNENPNRLLMMLKNMTNTPRRVQKEKDESYEKLRGQLRIMAGKKAVQLDKQIEYYRICHVYREESQYMWETCFAYMRAVINRLAQLWEQSKEDLWFLNFEELLRTCQEGFSKREEEIISRRKNYRKQAEDYWTSLSSLIVMETGSHELIEGVAGSSGVVSGRACIIRNKAEFSKLEKGDVLVCPFTDPEWTPLFALAVAVVSDTGGSLSHAAIVAREYGLPAVLGTGHSTSVIKDGEWLKVDGNSGRVVLMHDEKAKS